MKIYKPKQFFKLVEASVEGSKHRKSGQSKIKIHMATGIGLSELYRIAKKDNGNTLFEYDQESGSLNVLKIRHKGKLKL